MCSTDSIGDSTRLNTVQHSGGRSAGRIWPVRRRCATCLSACQNWAALPGQVCRRSGCIAAGEQVPRPCWLSR